MASYVNNLRLLEIAQGDESGTWGTKTNTNLDVSVRWLQFFESDLYSHLFDQFDCVISECFSACKFCQHVSVFAHWIDLVLSVDVPCCYYYCFHVVTLSVCWCGQIEGQMLQEYDNVDINEDI